MQPDRPLYEEMVRRGSRGRWFWLIGSRLATAGLVGVILVLILWPVMFFFKISDLAVLFAALLILMIGLFVLGSLLRMASYWIARGEGLDVDGIIGKPGGEK